MASGLDLILIRSFAKSKHVGGMTANKRDRSSYRQKHHAGAFPCGREFRHLAALLRCPRATFPAGAAVWYGRARLALGLIDARQSLVAMQRDANSRPAREESKAIGQQEPPPR